MRYVTTVVLASIATVGPAVCAPLDSRTFSSDGPVDDSTGMAIHQNDETGTLLRRNSQLDAFGSFASPSVRTMQLKPTAAPEPGMRVPPHQADWAFGDGMPEPTPLAHWAPEAPAAETAPAAKTAPAAETAPAAKTAPAPETAPAAKTAPAPETAPVAKTAPKTGLAAQWEKLGQKPYGKYYQVGAAAGAGALLAAAWNRLQGSGYSKRDEHTESFGNSDDALYSLAPEDQTNNVVESILRRFDLKARSINDLD